MRTQYRRRALRCELTALALLSTSGCSDRAGQPIDVPSLSGADTGVGSVDEGDSAGDDATGSDDGGAGRLDVGDGHPTTGGDTSGCRGIDFLFVVDNSGSMEDEQQHLIASFPGFVAAIEAKSAELGANDFHILVTDVDETRVLRPSDYCSSECQSGPTCSPRSGSDDRVPCGLHEGNCFDTCYWDIEGSCSAGACKEILGCDACGCNLGAGRVEDLGGTSCNVAGGERYIQRGQPDLDETFGCLAEVGLDGTGWEMQADAILGALEMDEGGGCNEGFLRRDSILVITVITDEDDDNGGIMERASAGDPPDWYANIVAARGGDADSIVMLGLLPDGNQPGAVCTGVQEGAAGDYAPRLHEFVQMFPKHSIASVCEPDYAPFFAESIDIIQGACEAFVPQG